MVVTEFPFALWQFRRSQRTRMDIIYNVLWMDQCNCAPLFVPLFIGLILDPG